MTTVLDIPLAQIYPHPDNPRKNVTVDADFDDLVASIRTNGVEQPCFVVDATALMHGGSTTPVYWLVGGHRRHAASKVAKTKTLPVIVRDDLVTPGQQLRFMLSENLHRLDLTPIETGDAIQALLDLGEGFTAASVAKATGLSARTVKDRLKLASMPEAARERIHAGQVTIADAMAMSEFSSDPATLATLTEAAGGDDFPYQLQKARDNKARNAAVVKATRLHSKGGGVVLTATPDDNDWSAIEEMDYYVDTFAGEPDPDEDADVAWERSLNLACLAHQSCPGHAVVIEVVPWKPGPQITPICTDRDTHHPDTGRLSGVPARTVTDVNLPRTPEQTTADQAALAAIDARTAARAEQRANLATAAKVRRAHLGTIVATANNELALKSLRATVKARIGTGYQQVDPTFAAQVLLDHPDAPHLLADHANLTKVVGYIINTLTLPALAILMSIFDGAPADRSLEAPSTWPGHADYYSAGDRTKSWRRLLVSVYDYAWSPVERELLGETLDVDDETTDVDEVQAAAS